MQRVAQLRDRAWVTEEYERTPWWRWRSGTFLATRAFCGMCSARAQVVHHRWYHRPDGTRVFYNETDQDLVALCRECHTDHHRHRGAGRRPRDNRP